MAIHISTMTNIGMSDLINTTEYAELSNAVQLIKSVISSCQIFNIVSLKAIT